MEKRLRQGDDENLGKESLEELMFRDHAYGRLTLGHVADLRSRSRSTTSRRTRRASSRATGSPSASPAAIRPDLGEKLAQALAALPESAQPPAAIPLQQPHRPRFLLVEKNADSTAISHRPALVALAQGPRLRRRCSSRARAFGEHRQFNGRLMQRLRELRGLNYGDYAYIEHFEQEGCDAATAQTGRARHQQEFSIWLRPVQNDNASSPLRAALYELSRSLKDEPFTPRGGRADQGLPRRLHPALRQTDARKLGYALDDAFYGMSGFLFSWRAALRKVTAEQVNAAWRKWIDPAHLEIAMAGKNMADVKKALLSGAPTPIHYQADAQGKTPSRPPAQLATDKQMEVFPFGIENEGDVQVVPVDRMFE